MRAPPRQHMGAPEVPLGRFTLTFATARELPSICAWRSGGAAHRMRAWPCPMVTTRRKIITQTKIGNKTRPIKAKLRNASCLLDSHQRNLWVLDFIRRSPPPHRALFSMTAGTSTISVGSTVRRRNAGSCPCRCSAQSATRFLRGRISVVIRVRIIQADPPGTEPASLRFGRRERRHSTTFLLEYDLRARFGCRLRLLRLRLPDAHLASLRHQE
jgi:hypothetical protein